ncbi:L-alanine-DL-glutamate epimerase-like enolase superfamily enzyme [Anseongella ginsenosidimutans]|uniref:Dipeptide epimerase n=1 Tax=Anseongella ginsenosidimutans TaxID=496056 RepID=A0A4R3KVC6_9SPHI|nr:dipeptide epimerase [Anseongella ginsenosidimutans]QEC51745.1 dipeptide epimerase [Anseongella ginsenosidimutans]TCS89108.1 L-alanine-DL-glutamate epimerase-like enolase superfamily enzyme [Anseongella ginsenosidimutans]
MKLNFRPFNLQLRHAFGISGHTRTSTPLVLTQIEHEDHTGFGEASMPPYLGESQETARQFLKKVDLARFSAPQTLEDVSPIMQYLDALAPGNTAAKAAVDIALHDLLGKIKDEPCYRLFGVNPAAMPATSFTIGIDTAEMLRKKVKEAEAFRVIKVKLGSDHDKETIEVIRSETAVPLSVDANQGWKNREEALEMIHWLSERKVLFIEQPMPKEDTEGNAWLRENSPLPVIADEACQRLADVEKAAGIYDGINIKLMKCTGLNEAAKMIKRARELDLKILIGCMTETSCAVMAAAALAPLCDWADLDGPWLVANDPWRTPALQDGSIRLENQPGLGIITCDRDRKKS